MRAQLQVRPQVWVPCRGDLKWPDDLRPAGEPQAFPVLVDYTVDDAEHVTERDARVEEPAVVTAGAWGRRLHELVLSHFASFLDRLPRKDPGAHHAGVQVLCEPVSVA